jgi:hypothetical protein
LIASDIMPATCGRGGRGGRRWSKATTSDSGRRRQGVKLTPRARMGNANILKKLRNVPATTRPTNPALTPRAQTVLGYLVYGIEEPDPDHPDIPTDKPLGPYQVAAILGVRRTYVRGLMADPVFKTEMARATADALAALEPKAVSTLCELLDWQGDGRAADANVRLNSAKTIMGEDAKGLSVNMNVQNNLVGGATQLGYVLGLPAKFKPPTIEGEPR